MLNLRSQSRELLNVAKVFQHLWDMEHNDVHVGSDMLVLTDLHQSP